MILYRQQLWQRTGEQRQYKHTGRQQKKPWLHAAVYEKLRRIIQLILWHYRDYVREWRKAVGDTFTTFYSNSAKEYDKHKFQCQDIYNVHRMLVQKPSIIVAEKGMKQVRAVTYAERGSGHHDCGCKHKWSFCSAILRIPTEETQGLVHCKGTRWQCWMCRQVRVDDRR